MMCFGHYVGGWNNQSLGEGLLCNLGIDENLVVDGKFDMCSVLVVGVCDM